MTDPRWYERGVRFRCGSCGNCCRAHEGYSFVYLTPRDVADLAEHLGLDELEFLARHCEERDGWTTLRTREPACAFLTEQGTCGVYEARPMQCRTWPFWKPLLERGEWQRVVRSTCKGIGRGPLISADEIDALAERNERWYASDGRE